MLNDDGTASQKLHRSFCGEWLLLRHAESVSNEMRVWTGQSDVALSERGVRSLRLLRADFEKDMLAQARTAGEVTLGDMPKPGGMLQADVVVSSPLVRCVESVRILLGRDPDMIIDEFMECGLGDWVGLPYSDLTDDARYLDWVRPPYRKPPNGESLPEFRERVGRGVERLQSSLAHGAAALIMTHGNVMRAIMSLEADSSVAHRDWDIPNNGGYRLRWLDGRVSEWGVFRLTGETCVGSAERRPCGIA